MIRIEKRGKRIYVYASVPLTGMKTAIPGAYENTAGVWTVPLTYENCVLLQQRFGKRMKVGTELQRWAVGVQQARKYMGGVAAADQAVLEVLPRAAPKLYKAMQARPYQLTGARFVADADAPLIADEPGLGKTLITMGGIIESEIPGPYLIIAPKTAARTVWEYEIRRWLPSHHKAVAMPEARLARERKLRRTPFGDHTWVIVHPEMVLVQVWLECHECGNRSVLKKARQVMLPCGHKKVSRKTKVYDVPGYPQLMRVPWGVIVVDESQDSLIRRKGLPTQRRHGMNILPLRADGKRIAASGTPFKSKPHLIFGTLNWLAPKTYPAFHRWSETFWRKGGYTGFELGEFIQEREQLLWDSLQTICLRRTKAEVAPDLPPKMQMGTRLVPEDDNSPVGVWLDITGKQAAAYEAMLTNSSARLKSGRLEAITALAELTRLKQLASSHGDITRRRMQDGSYDHKFVPALPSNKFQWTVETLEEWGFPREPIGKVVIVSFYTSLLNMFSEGLEKYFKTKPKRPLTSRITGQTANKKAVLQRFNAHDNEHVLLLNLRAGGTAITIDSADRMIFLTETRIPDEQTQAEDRLHRVSNPRHCMYYYLRSVGTVDVGTAVANIELAHGSSRLLDGRRGIDYLKYVIEHSR